MIFSIYCRKNEVNILHAAPSIHLLSYTNSVVNIFNENYSNQNVPDIPEILFQNGKTYFNFDNCTTKNTLKIHSFYPDFQRSISCSIWYSRDIKTEIKCSFDYLHKLCKSNYLEAINTKDLKLPIQNVATWNMRLGNFFTLSEIEVTPAIFVRDNRQRFAVSFLYIQIQVELCLQKLQLPLNLHFVCNEATKVCKALHACSVHCQKVNGI